MHFSGAAPASPAISLYLYRSWMESTEEYREARRLLRNLLRWSRLLRHERGLSRRCRLWYRRRMQHLLEHQVFRKRVDLSQIVVLPLTKCRFLGPSHPLVDARKSIRREPVLRLLC